MLITLGSILDKRKHSVESCYPLSICRSDPCSTFNTVLPVQFSLSCDSNYRYAIYIYVFVAIFFGSPVSFQSGTESGFSNHKGDLGSCSLYEPRLKHMS